VPGAGFYPIGASHIMFGRDGHWYADGERIANRRIALLFSRHLVRLGDGSYALVMGDEKASVEVQDTPWVVTRVDGHPDRGFRVTLNDETQERLDPASLAIEPDHAFSCRVKGGTRVRFLRSAYNVLARYIDAGGEAGRFVLEVQGRRHLLAPRRPDDGQAGDRT
jgi:hypothetical protein